MAYSPGQRLLLRNGKFAQFVRQVLRLGGEIFEVVLADGSPRLVNARDVLVTDWLGVERRVSQQRKGERRQVKLRLARRTERRTHPERRTTNRREFAAPKKRPSETGTSDESPRLPEEVKLMYKYRRNLKARKRFFEGAKDGAAGRSFAYDDIQTFVRQHGQVEFTAYAEGYSEGRAARYVTQ